MNRLLASMILLGGVATVPAHAENAFAGVYAEPAARYIPGAASATPSVSYVQQRDEAAIRAWKRSLIPLVATQSLDIASSYGMRELNPLLAGPNGEFGAKGIAIKTGTTAAIVGVEYLIVKKWPSSARILSKVNWGTSAVTGVIAARNFAIK